MKKTEGGHRALMAGRLAKRSVKSKGTKARSPVGVVVKIRKGMPLGTAISLQKAKPTKTGGRS